MKTDPWSFVVHRLLSTTTTLDDRRAVVAAIKAVFPSSHKLAPEVCALDEALSIALLAQRELCLNLSQPTTKGGRRLSDRIETRGAGRLDVRKPRG